ncbi:MAG: hypothetical protein LUG18_06295 [Candidatus Azobacteroides sp.]|nr:hypothetical protein [Candidatus Azobacteroides sp.]
MNKLFLLLFFLFSSFISIYSQAIGEWQTYFSYSTITQVCETKNKIFALGVGSLFSCEKDGTDIQTYSKINGLNDNNIVKIAYSTENNLLLIAYENANIDLLMEDGIVNIPDFMNKIMVGNKTVNDIYFDGDLAYLSTGVGIVVVNIKKYEIKESYVLKKNDIVLSIYSLAIQGDEIFVTTSEGVYKGNVNENLLDFNKWITISEEGTMTNGIKVVSFQGSLYVALKNEEISKYEGDKNWSRFMHNGTVQDIHISDGHMIIATPTQIFDYTSENERTFFQTGFSTGASAIASGEKEGCYWLAANSSGLNYINENAEVIYSNISPDGPSENIVYKQKLGHGALYFVNGTDRGDGVDSKVMKLDVATNKWTIIGEENNAALKNVTNLILHPSIAGKFYVTSFRQGMYEFENDIFKRIYSGTTNPGDIDYISGTQTTFLSSPAFDQNENLWLGNGQTSYGIKILKPDNTWERKFYSDLSDMEFYEMLILSNGQKWLLGTNNSKYWGIYILDGDNGKRHKKFNDQDGNQADAQSYFSIVQDKNNSVWVGSDKGVLVFNNFSNVLDNNYTCSRIKIPRNDGSGLADYLLGSERINAIAVDGGNRKWLGTQNSGLYLVSEDGLQTIHYFTSENSPLPSDQILSLSIEPNTGLVFIGTSKGLLSYKSDAIEGKNDYSNVYVYPNPVRPDYSGWITVTGLVENSTVKITDISGELVNEGTSQGGQYSWDGKNKYGERVATGVYLVFASSSDGSESSVAKIMMIK